MRQIRSTFGWTLAASLLALAFSAAPLAAATTPDQEAAEMLGTGDAPGGLLPAPDPQKRIKAMGMLPAGGLLLVPDSDNDRIMAFDPADGSLVDPDFIPADPTNLSTPIQCILHPDGESFLVSDQLEDVVQQYDMDGNYVGVFAPAGGVNNAILDNIRGITLRPNGNLLVTVGGGANDDSVAEFDTTGAYLGNFVAVGAGGLNSPFDVIEVTGAGVLTGGDYLVGGITSDDILQYDSTGAFVAEFAPMDTFPEQLHQIANGNILVGNFLGAQEGVVELDPNGGVVGVYDPASLGGYRGVFELPSGNILTTNGGGLHEIDRTGTLIQTINPDANRFITLVQGAPVMGPTPVVPAIPTLGTWGLIALVTLLLTAGLVAIRRLRA